MTDRLESRLAAHAAALEAPAGEPNWIDVRRKARRLAARRRALRLGATALIAIVAVFAATPAFGLRGRLIQVFASSEPAPSRVVKDFAELDLAAPAGMATGVIADEARDVLEVPLSTGKTAVLWVAPTRSGGFCLGLSTSGPRSGGGGGCDRDRSLRFSPGLSIPGPFTSDGRILRPPVVIDGDTLIARAARVEVRYEDGAVAETPVVWVSAPIEAGFFIYEIPEAHWEAGHRPSVLVVKDRDGKELARAANFFWPSLPIDRSTGIPVGAIESQRRELIAITTDQGTREALWVAPRQGGGRCQWLTSDGHPGRSAGCPPPAVDPPASKEIASVGLLSGSAPILFDGEVGEEVAALELRYQDGEVQRLQPVEGFVLAEIPSQHWPQGHRLYQVVALDALGREMSRRPFATETPGTYPCSKPVDLGAGMKACA
ncbi:MAG: hypothetical protein M3R39_09740 [Actinomycetota bacterium]|nr:hypothetical protein [Actinomycetota bacterium]